MTGDRLVIDAAVENLPKVHTFIEEHLEGIGCPLKAQLQIGVAVEEIFVNIAHYAYELEKGRASVSVDSSDDTASVTITFKDHGVPYDPLAREDPDVTLSAQDRRIGGLGVFMAKKTMDEVTYERRDGQNILTMKKKLPGLSHNHV